MVVRLVLGAAELVRLALEGELLHYTILYYTIPYHTIPYHTILYYTILYDTIGGSQTRLPGRGRSARPSGGPRVATEGETGRERERYSQFASQEVRPSGPNPRKVLQHYLSTKGAWATQPLEMILRSEFL